MPINNKQNAAYIPGHENIGNSNISQFMKKHGIADYHHLIQKSNENIEWYWNAVNDDLNLNWFQKYELVFDSSKGIPHTKWFIGGKCNIISNVIDRHVKNQPYKIAYIFENQNGTSKKVSYKELDLQVNLLASALKGTGIRKGDVVGIYMPMIPEAIFSIFACSKIGAVHTTIFSGFNSQALYTRLNDSGAKILITSDKMHRRSTTIDLKKQWLQSVKNTHISKIITVGKKDQNNDKIISYDEFIKNSRSNRRPTSCETEPMDSEDPLFILYTSGTTGKPKGTLHVHAGFMIVAAQQTAYLIDMKPTDTLFWYADIGWITGQTWVVYGSPIIGGTALIYDNALDYPEVDTWCKLICKHKVSIFGAAPTAIRLFMKNNIAIDNYNLSSLRILATTGETINKEAWIWYFENVGKKLCPVINLSGGTEIGGAIISALPVIPLKPCTVGLPIPGFDADVLDDEGNRVKKGYLVIKKPWPSMTRGLLNDWKKFIETYWSKYKDMWYHGDLAFIDSDGLWYILGRVDDVIKTSGHRIGSAEIEAAATSHRAVAEAIAIGIPDEVKGQSIVVYIILKREYFDKGNDTNLRNEIMQIVEDVIGRFARPEQIKFVSDMPKTLTGKIMRRLIREKKAINDDDNGKNLVKDLTAVENPASLDLI